MRIIAGEYKGRRLKSINKFTIRPATDRVKGSIFNSLQNRMNLANSMVLDLFAGSGSLGFEALSRGASRVYFIDNDSDAIELIKANAYMLDCIEKCHIYRMGAEEFIDSTDEKFDIIFADPPYRYEKLTYIPELIFRKNLLCNGGYLIIEHSKHTKFSCTDIYRITLQKQFGNTIITYFIHPNNEEENR